MEASSHDPRGDEVFSTRFFSALLALPASTLAYEAGRRIAAMRPGHYVLELDVNASTVHDALLDGVVEGRLSATAHCQIGRRYVENEDRLGENAQNAAYELRFRGAFIEVVLVTFVMGECTEIRAFVVAEDRAAAEAFALRVCRHAAEVDGQVLVFECGGWSKDEKLFDAVKRTSLDSLVLRGSMKEDILKDIRAFFTSRAVYEQHRVPYKRGVLLYGPPGNGKTHFLKGLIASLDVPCLYVKSLIAQYHNEHEGLRRIFGRARMMAPCLLVFEDLESVLSDKNRSFFLNELDGFAENTGIVVLATTNYPEQIDPAIIDRPSRFDRKYLFDLPSSEERATYLAKWNDSLVGDMRASREVLDRAAGQTSGFSFAYLKELAMSATMRWMEHAGALSMDEVLPALVASLKEQVTRGRSPGSSKAGRRVGLVPEA